MKQKMKNLEMDNNEEEVYNVIPSHMEGEVWEAITGLLLARVLRVKI